MKKYLLTTLLVAVVALSCFAQEDNRTSVGVDAGFPVGSSANDFSFAIGGSLKIENAISDNALITISMGYTSLSTKSTLLGANVKPPASVYTPLKFGVKYKIAGPLFAEGQIGAAFEIRGQRATRFIYSPGLVCNIDKFDVGLRYENWNNTSSNIGQVALRVGLAL